MKILKFSAGWCAPCKVLKTLLTGFDECPIEDIDIDSNDELTLQYNIRSVPTLVLLDDENQEVWRHSGTIDRALLANTVKKYGR